MDKKVIIGTLLVLAVTIGIGIATAENEDSIGYRYLYVTDMDSMMAYGDRLSGSFKSYDSNELALKWYRMVAEHGDSASKAQDDKRASMALVKMGNIYREGWGYEEDLSKALRCFREALEADPESVEARIELAMTYGLMCGDYRSGHNYIDKAIEIDSTNLEALWCKARLYARQQCEGSLEETIAAIDAIDSTFVARKMKEEGYE